MSAAAEHATSLAKNHGAGWVAVKNSNHCGALPFYGLKVAAAGCVGFVITHTDPIMLPFGSKEAFLGTNPLCVTFPDSDGRPFCLDMSTSIVAWNRILAARRENRPLEGGWAVDADGKDTRDPHAARALLPAAAHKGSGLAVMIDLICAVLTGMPFGADLPHMLAVRETRHLGGHVGALKLASFGDDRALRSQVREYAERMRALIPLEAGASVKYPGEIEEARTRQYSAEGIPLLPSTLMELQRLAATYGVPWLC